MKKLLLILFLLPTVLCSQDSERVLEIQKMYNKITLDKDYIRSEECKSVEWRNHKVTSYSRDFCGASECVYPDDHSTIGLSYYLGKGRYDINMQRWILVSFYFKNENLYFATYNQTKDNKRTDGKEYDETKPNFTEINTSIYFKENGEVEKMLIRNQTTVDGRKISETEDLVEDEKRIKRIKKKTLRFLEMAEQQLNLTEEEREEQREIHKQEEQGKMRMKLEEEGIRGNNGEFNLKQAFEDGIQMGKCMCEFMRISQEMSDPEKAEGLKNKMEEQEEKCQKIEKEIERKILKSKNTNPDYEVYLYFGMDQGKENCKYLKTNTER